MANKLEGTHKEFLRMIMGKRANYLGDGTLETPGAEGIQEEDGTKSARIYIEQRQATMAHWMAILPLSGVCTRETGYEGGGRRRKMW